MAILTHDVIVESIEKGEIHIDPFDPKSIGPASIDFTCH